MTATLPLTQQRTLSGVAMAGGAMLSVQLGLATSVELAGSLGPVQVAWLRLLVAGAVLLVAVRPWRAAWTRASLAVCVLLGLVSGAMTVLFMLAAARLPLGTASALEFTGPLTVALVRGQGRARWWALPAAAGLVLLTRPWTGSADVVGVAIGLCSGACWAGYILLTERAGALVSGAKPLGVSIPVAAVAVSFVALPTGLRPVTPDLVLPVVAAALLVPLLPFVLELLAIRRLPTATFSTLMSIEPAVATAVGLVVLHQALGPLELVGVVLVVTASVMTERANRPQPVLAVLPA